MVTGFVGHGDPTLHKTFVGRGDPTLHKTFGATGVATLRRQFVGRRDPTLHKQFVGRGDPTLHKQFVGHGDPTLQKPFGAVIVAPIGRPSMWVKSSVFGEVAQGTCNGHRILFAHIPTQTAADALLMYHGVLLAFLPFNRLEGANLYAITAPCT